jgi:hypothetical protein
MLSSHLASTAISQCERTATDHHTTLAVIVVFALLGACGGNHRDTYAKATNAQEKCCENLSGNGRTTCLQKIVRIDDPKVASSRINQQTFACVHDHFTCDAATGTATKESAQAQLECIQDLQQ